MQLQEQLTMSLLDVGGEEMDEDDDGVGDGFAVADYAVVRGQFRRAADRPPVPPRVVSNDVTTRSRARRRTSGLLRHVQLALALGVVRAPSPPQGVRLPVGVPRAGVLVGRRRRRRRPRGAHLPPPLGARVHAAQHASQTAAPPVGRPGGAARTRAHRGKLAVAVARPFDVRRVAAGGRRASHVAARVVGDARRQGADVAGRRRRALAAAVADRLRPLPDAAPSAPVAARQQSALVALEA